MILTKLNASLNYIDNFPIGGNVKDKYMKRQEYWKKLGYTDEQIQNHLRFERYKSKQARELRKKNNEENKDIIKKIKDELLNKEFLSDNRKVKILRIARSVDGKGAWIKYLKTFSDNSFGEYRYFVYFGEYKKEELLEELYY